jgi:two-component sensor histidine kinase
VEGDMQQGRRDPTSGQEAAGAAAAEAARLAALRRYDILDSPPEASFDRVAALAASLFDAPIAIIGLVDRDRIWFKARHGIDATEAPRAPGAFPWGLLQGEPLLLNAALRQAPRPANPLATGELAKGFYLGAPLRTWDGFYLGVLCVIDRRPHGLVERRHGQLAALALLVMDQMELRLAARGAAGALAASVALNDVALGRAAMLAQEIDHRVMNSLQFISSLLSMQSRAAGPGETARQLSMAANRVTAVAQVHRHIFGHADGAAVEAAEYLGRLCHDLVGILDAKNPAEISVEAEVAIPVAALTPIGLIVNELVTNAVKHGASPIVVALRATTAGGALLSVTDCGPGLMPGFDPAASRGLGMKVVLALAGQLGGRLTAVTGAKGRGACFTVALPRL